MFFDTLDMGEAIAIRVARPGFRVDCQVSGLAYYFMPFYRFLDGADHRAATQGGASTFSRFFRRGGTQVLTNIIFTNRLKIRVF